MQGPCKENQEEISSTEFLQYSVAVLAEDEKLFVSGSDIDKPSNST